MNYVEGARRRAMIGHWGAACLRSGRTAPARRAALRCAARNQGGSELYLRLIAHNYDLTLSNIHLI